MTMQPTLAKTYTTRCPVCHKKWQGPAGTYSCTCGTEYKLYSGQGLQHFGEGMAEMGKAITSIFISLVFLSFLALLVYAFLIK